MAKTPKADAKGKMPEAKCTEKEAREMSQLLNSGITDIAVCAIIAALCIAVTVSEVRKKIKAKRNGTCAYGCAYCSGCTSCSCGGQESGCSQKDNAKRGQK